MNSPLSFHQLRDQYPRTAELFRASRNWRPNKEHDISKELVTFLDLKGFEINIASTEIDEPITYKPTVKSKEQKVDIGGRTFPNDEQARLHALDYVIDIFEEEQKILA